MSTHTAAAAYYPRSLPKLPTFPKPPPTISGEELARMVPPMATANVDFSQDLASSDEEVGDSEAKTEPPSKKLRAQTKKCPTAGRTKASQKPPPKQDSTRGRAQKKRAASTQAKKAMAVSKKKNTKKTGT